jgi:hypothetical protein
MKFEHPWEPFVPVGAGSIGEKSPELVFILDDVCHYQLDLPRFEEEFLETFGKHPKAEDYLHFYETRFAIFDDGTQHWFQELKKVSPDQAHEIEKNYQRKIRELKNKIVLFRSEKNLENVKKGVEGFQSNVLGMMGELYGISAIPKVKTASTLIGQMPVVVSKLETKMEWVREQIKQNPDFFKKLETEFPHVFNSTAVNNQFRQNPGVTTEKKLQFIQKWIHQKEIDFVRSSGEVDTWLELKTKQNPMTLEEFIKDRRGWKSPERQIMEDREILEFLGLDDQIKLEYYVTSGMEKDLKRALNELGVKPIEFKSVQLPGAPPTVH